MAIGPGTVIQPGATLATVDDVPVVAMAGDAPPYRALSAGDKGEDVARLQQFLAATGYLSTAADGTYGSSTVRAVRAWNKDHGRRGDSFDPASIVWIGTGPFDVAEVPVKVGGAASPGQPIAIGPALLEAVEVEEPAGGIASGAYLVRVGDVAAPYEPGTGLVSDPAAAAAVVAALGRDQGAGQLVQADPVEVAVIPASAVVTDSDGRTCVFPDATSAATLIEPVGSAAGAVHLAPDTSIREVLVNPAQVREDLSCGS